MGGIEEEVSRAERMDAYIELQHEVNAGVWRKMKPWALVSLTSLVVASAGIEFSRGSQGLPGDPGAVAAYLGFAVQMISAVPALIYAGAERKLLHREAERAGLLNEHYLLTAQRS